MRLFSLREHDSVEADPVSPAASRALEATTLVAASLTLDGRLLLRSGSVVGAARITVGGEQVEVRVRPKMPISRLFWLLSHARDPRGWRAEPVGLTAEQDLVPAMAAAFTSATTQALRAGVLQGYRVVEEGLPVLRGRLREADQLRARPGFAVPVEVRYDDYTVDILENRILLAATRRLARLPGVPPAHRVAMRRITSALADVSPLTAGLRVPETIDNRLNARYQPALRLARLILAGSSLEQPPGLIAGAGFAFDLDTVFEDWLTKSLREAIQTRYGGRVADQRHVDLDEEARLPKVRPDITWWDADRCLAVVDAKYKAPGSTPPRDDIYQILAYCTALRLRRGHLVYGSASHEAVDYRITGGGQTISVHGLDLSAPIAEVRRRVEAIAEMISSHAEPARAPGGPERAGPGS